MAKWDRLRRARDNIRANRSVALLPSVMTVVLDEIRELKNEMKSLKKKLAP